MSSRMCVYTTLIGGYERLNEQPMAKRSSLPFVCLTDDGDLKSETWEIRRVRPVFGMDPVRSQRDMKIRSHAHLPEFDRSLYIDNSVLLTQPPEVLFAEPLPESGLRLPEHSHRKSVLDEFVEVSRRGFDDQNRIFEQLNHYMCDTPAVLEEAPYWTAILLRDHRNDAVRGMLEVWANHVLRYSRRDQLSINFALRHSGLTPQTWRIDNYESWFHSWPHTPMRQRDKGMRSLALALTAPNARIRSLEIDLSVQEEIRRSLEQVVAEQERKHQTLEMDLSVQEEIRRSLERKMAEQELKRVKLVRSPGRLLKLAAKQALRGWRKGPKAEPAGHE